MSQTKIITIFGVLVLCAIFIYLIVRAMKKVEDSSNEEEDDKPCSACNTLEDGETKSILKKDKSSETTTKRVRFNL